MNPRITVTSVGREVIAERHTCRPGDTLVVLAPDWYSGTDDSRLREALEQLMPWLGHVVVVCEVDGIRSEWTRNVL